MPSNFLLIYIFFTHSVIFVDQYISMESDKWELHGLMDHIVLQFKDRKAWFGGIPIAHGSKTLCMKLRLFAHNPQSPIPSPNQSVKHLFFLVRTITTSNLVTWYLHYAKLGWQTKCSFKWSMHTFHKHKKSIMMLDQ